MLIRYCGEWVYGTPNVSNTATALAIHDVNFQLNNGVNGDTNMHFNIQGEWSSWHSAAEHPTSCIENWYYLAHDAKIVTTEPHITYLSEGAFYDQDTVDLYCGRAWLKKTFTFNNGELPGYGGLNGTTNSVVTYFKNLWSGEVIFQYNLYPSDTSVFPTIPKPERFSPRKSIYIKPRYLAPHTDCTSIFRMRSTNFHVYRGSRNTSYSVAPFDGCQWITGSNYWIGDIESPGGNRTETNPLWHHDAATAIPSINTSSYSNIGNPAHNMIVATYTNHVDHTYWDDSSEDRIFEHADKTTSEGLMTEGTYVVGCRSGMIFNYIDSNPTTENVKNGTFETNFMEIGYGDNQWTPHTGYNCGSNTNQPVYYMGLVFENSINPNWKIDGNNYTIDADIFCPNLYMFTVPPADTGNVHAFGTSGGLYHVAGNRIIFAGHFLSNQP